MTPSSPSPSRTLHQHANTDSDQDEGPEYSEPIVVEPAKLLEQKQHAQGHQDDGSHRHARRSVDVLRHRFTFHRNARDRSCGCCRLAGTSEQVHVIEAEWIGGLQAHLFRLRRAVRLDRHVQHKGRDADAEDAAYVIGCPDQAGEYQHMNKSLGVFAVIHGAHARYETENGRQPWAVAAIRWRDGARRYGPRPRRWRHGAAHLRGQTLLAVNDATHISPARAAHGLATCAAVCDCGNFDMVGAVHAVLLFSRACGVSCSSTTGQLASTGWLTSRL